MQIRKATMNDLPDILAIYAYARKYMKEHGNPDQWRGRYPPVLLYLGPVAGQLSSGFTYHTGYPVRLLICLHHSDRRR